MILSIAVLLQAAFGAQYDVHRWAEAGGAVSAVLVGPADRNRADTLIEFLKNTNAPVATISVFSSRRAASLGVQQGGVDLTYEQWERLGNRQRRTCGPALHLLKIGSGIAIRSVDTEGQVTQTVIEGPDPFIFRAGGRSYRVLHVYLRTGTGEPLVGEPAISWFLQTNDGSDAGACEAAFEYLHRLAAASIVSVGLRNDSWFLTSGAFPICYPFDASVPGSRAEFRKLPEAVCVKISPWPVRCWNETPE